MKKQDYKNNRVLPNMTGRRFMCVSKKSDLVDSFDDNFTIGKIYPEAKIDCEGDNLSNKKDDILLISDNNVPIYIDLSDFVEVEGISSIVINSWIYLN